MSNAMPCRRRSLNQLRVALFALSVAWASGWTNGAEPAKPVAPAPKPARDGSILLDQELLKDLDNELLDGVQNLPAGKKPAATDKSRSKQDPTAPGCPRNFCPTTRKWARTSARARKTR